MSSSYKLNIYSSGSQEGATLPASRYLPISGENVLVITIVTTGAGWGVGEAAATDIYWLRPGVLLSILVQCAGQLSIIKNSLALNVSSTKKTCGKREIPRIEQVFANIQSLLSKETCLVVFYLSGRSCAISPHCFFCKQKYDFYLHLHSSSKLPINHLKWTGTISHTYFLLNARS